MDPVPASLLFSWYVFDFKRGLEESPRFSCWRRRKLSCSETDLGMLLGLGLSGVVSRCELGCSCRELGGGFGGRGF